MEKKKWHRSPGIKGLLLLLQYIFLGAVIFLGLFLITSLAHGLRLSDSGKDYLDSTAFANTLYDAAYDVMYGISGTFPYTNVSWKGLAQNEASQSSDKNASSEAHTSLNQTSASQVVDLNEIANDEEISFQNTSGLAYSVSDLEKWAQDFDTSSGNPIVICHQASFSADESLSRHYYYVDDFLEKIDSGELDFSVDMEYYGFSDSATEIASYDENLKQLIEDIKNDMQYGVMDDLSGIQITSGDGKVLYDSISLYDGYYEPTEAYPPQGADSILDVLNSNAKWNDRIDEAFESLYSLLSRTDFYIQQEQILKNYSQGHSNMSYIYINEDDGQVISNDSELEAQLGYTLERSVTHADSAIENPTADNMGGTIDYCTKLTDLLKSINGISYVLIQYQPDGFTSNLAGLRKYNTFPGNNVTCDSWKEVANSLLPAVNSNFIFAAYVDQTFPVSDTFATDKTFFENYSSYQKPVFLFFLLCSFLFLAAFVWLTAIAGRKNSDQKLHLCFFDRWPTELSAGLILLAWFPVLVLLLQCLSFADYQIGRLRATSLLDVSLLLKLMILGLYTLFWFQIGYLSLVRRIKAKQLWKNSILRRLLVLTSRLIHSASHKLHALADLYSRNTAARLKATFAFLCFLFIKYIICGPLLGSMQLFFFFSCLADLLILLYVITKACSREQIIKGLREISNGNLQYKIPLERLWGDDKHIAEYINNIGSGLDAAVENSVKNERMKTELITNVSHDLKTPLTSIISYIDLLKRENFTDPKVLEYLDILEAKATRLKVLTEDVVEASKASTGNLTLNMNNLDFVEMLHQVIGEFEERFEEHHLTMIVHFPDEPSVIYADGQRLWRVLENIFGNVTKYAMEDTRVYAEVMNAHGQVVFTLKNISAQPLNFAAEELTERFVRGDVARGTEGSGLGLSIAKSLTELQGGKFQLYLDGDLFKVTITFQAQNSKCTDAEVPAQPKPEAR